MNNSNILENNLWIENLKNIALKDRNVEDTLKSLDMDIKIKGMSVLKPEIFLIKTLNPYHLMAIYYALREVSIGIPNWSIISDIMLKYFKKLNIKVQMPKSKDKRKEEAKRRNELIKARHDINNLLGKDISDK